METKHLSPFQQGVVGVQFLFVAFGATVIVPLLVGLDPSVALFTAGIGTLLFHLVTKGKVPIYLGSSFAFIAPITESTRLYGLPGTLCGLVAVAGVYFLISFLVKWQGTRLIDRLFPSTVIGPVIILIGLSLAGTGVNMAKENWVLAICSLATAVLISLLARGIWKLIPIFCGIIVGYTVACIGYDVNFQPVLDAPWIGLPAFVTPHFSWQAILYMIPVAIAPIIEHIGDIYTIGAVTGKDYVKDPGLHRTMLGDGLACLFAGFVGGPPATTYSEVTGAISLTKISDPKVIRIAAVTAILFSVVGKISALLQSIPSAVLGGIMLLLFGTIASAGIQSMIHDQTKLEQTRNMVIVSLTLTVGIGGAVLNCGSFSMSGIGLAALLGMLLNLILPPERTAK
ncbi:MAG: uracil-xanthine permease family protein [Bacteroides sp.]|jgi:uracil permease|nr:uracil-xanthine permease family protein [Bacteroides sp.]